MAKLLFTLFLLVSCQMVNAQQLYHKWFGDPKAEKSVVFLHGGPGYNSANFEFHMAKELVRFDAQVLVYDQRGSGRSEALSGEFSYEEAVNDLFGLLKARGVTNTYILGHSFGGVIGLHFAEKYPEMVTGLVLVSAPMDFPACFRSIQANCLAAMENREDTLGPKSIHALAAMDTTTLEYSGTNFMYAMANGLYSPSESFKSGKKLHKKLARDPLGKWAKKSSYAPVKGFFEKEHYTTGNYFPMLERLAKKVPCTAIFGEDDGLFDEGSIQRFHDVPDIVDVYVLSLASHAVYLDDPYGFLDIMGEIFSRK